MNLTSSQIAQHEQKARTRHLSAVQHIGDNQLPFWFTDFLEHTVLPPLVQIGLDREIAGSIFRISAHAWKSMGPVTDLKLRFHPSLVRDICEIRGEIVSHDEEGSQNPVYSTEALPDKPTDIAERAMQQDTLSELLQTIPTTWIILPRAHSFLAKNDSQCLLIYLQHLDMESNRAFEKILTRILIEFFGNYSLKFISSSLPKKQMVEAIFYGYTAMFWKNLQQPPKGLEDLLLFRNYLSWAKAFKKRASSLESEKEAIIQQMEDVADSIVPDHNIRTLVRSKNLDTDCLHIALRHGRPGINSTVRYFTMNNAQLLDSSHDRNKTLPKQITTLFRKLRRSYDDETPRTREFIHTFLMELRSAYNPRTTHPPYFRKKSRDDLAFTRGRMSHLIEDFSRSIN